MKKKFLLLIFLLAGAYYFWTQIFGFKQKAPPPPVVAASPLEQVEAVLSQDPISAESLHSIYLKFPDLVRKQLNQRTIKIRGIARKMMVTGFKKQRLELYLSGLANPRIALVVDLDDYKLFNEVTGSQQSGWEIAQGRVFLVRYEFVSEDSGPGRNLNPRRVLKAIGKRHVFTEGLDATQQCRLRNWNSASLYFFYEPTLGEPFLGNPSR
jgi:hypothetical protein